MIQEIQNQNETTPSARAEVDYSKLTAQSFIDVIKERNAYEYRLENNIGLEMAEPELTNINTKGEK